VGFTRLNFATSSALPHEVLDRVVKVARSADA
jgi:hypothetical protein